MFAHACGYLRAHMSSGEIPESVLRFILDHIDSVPHLETLLLLWENPARSWNAKEVASRVYVSADDARHVLAGLARRGFLSALPEPEPTFRYDPQWDTEGKLISAVADSAPQMLVFMSSPCPPVNAGRWFAESRRCRHAGRSRVR